MWVIDYPLFERIYYALVAGFDVYGTAGHQLALRHYMDALRVEGESYFLDFMPPERRKPIMQSWYKGVDLEELHFSPTGMPARISFVTEDPKRELIEELVSHHFAPAVKVAFDPLNFLPAGAVHPDVPRRYDSPGDYLQALRALTRPGTAFLSVLDDSNANLAYVRIRLKTGRDLAVSIVINRWHDNVAHMFGEGGKLDASKDTADFIPGLIGSYPNYFFDVREEDFPDFVDLLAHFKKGPADAARLARYGVKRADERLWDAYDWFQQRFHEDEPVEGGLFDLNRYYHQAR
jgi:hypothetical protein